jgi:4-hydroxybenzoate polyprenyltransferase
MTWDRFKTLLRFIRIEHNVFSLTFVYAGALLSIQGVPPLRILFWITLALFGARSGAIVLADIVDREIDARNPRTKDRHLPSGKVSLREAKIVVVLSYLLLFFSAYQLNPLAFALSPVPLLLALAYPYSKRHTPFAHLLLGLNLAFAPIGGWVGVTGSLSLPPLLLALGVALWVGGFDILYACQDIAFDRREGLHSLPADYGIRPSLWVSAGMHLLTLLFLFSVFFLMDLGILYLLGLITIALLLAYEHILVSEGSLERIPKAFFEINALVSVVVFLSVLGEVLWPVPL